jgi:hypothetical protein
VSGELLNLQRAGSSNDKDEHNGSQETDPTFGSWMETDDRVSEVQSAEWVK